MGIQQAYYGWLGVKCLNVDACIYSIFPFDLLIYLFVWWFVVVVLVLLMLMLIMYSAANS